MYTPVAFKTNCQTIFEVEQALADPASLMVDLGG
jgi:hypothetical protein